MQLNDYKRSHENSSQAGSAPLAGLTRLEELKFLQLAHVQVAKNNSILGHVTRALSNVTLFAVQRSCPCTACRTIKIDPSRARLNVKFDAKLTRVSFHPGRV